MPPRGLSPQQAVWRLLRPQEELSDPEQTLRSRPLEANEAIRAAHEVRACFRNLLRTRGDEQFTAWQQTAEARAVPAGRGCVASLHRDEEAVRAALTADGRSGQGEGQVTQVKLVKRLMVGRANCDGLRRRARLAG
jgi:transposase